MTLYDIIAVAERITASVRLIEETALQIRADSMILLDVQTDYLRLMAEEETGIAFDGPLPPEDLEDLLSELDCCEDATPLTTGQRRQLREWTMLGNSPYAFVEMIRKKEGGCDEQKKLYPADVTQTQAKIRRYGL